MSERSAIEWTEATWNPVTGCSKVSSGCANCYAERLACRLSKMGNVRYRKGFEVALHDDLLTLPLKWKRPRMVFVNSMSDLYHEQVPDDFVRQVFATMNQASRHTFQVLTKRAERMMSLSGSLNWSRNIWQGVSVENGEVRDRVDFLRAIPCSVRFLSLEPLLGPLSGLDLTGINWVIVGGESGPKARPMEAEWVREIRDNCTAAGVPFFFKQWGGTQKHRNGRTLDGRTWDEYPKDLQ